MSLVQQISSDLKDAMLKKEAVRVSALRMLKAALTNLEISQKGKTVSDADVRSLIQKQINQRKDSIEQYQKGGREDLVKSERAEVVIFEAYLPPQLDDEKLESAVRQTLTENKLQTKKEFGQAMKILREKLQGQADNKRISAILNKVLT